MAATPKPVRKEIKKRVKNVKNLYAKDKKGKFKDIDVIKSKMSEQEVRSVKKSIPKEVKETVKRFYK